MPDNQSSENIEHERAQDRPPLDATIPSLAQDSPDANNSSQITNNEVAKDVKALEDRIKAAEKWMIGLTGAIALFGLCQVIAAFLQWRAMDGQLKEMRTGAMDTHDLAVAANKQAAAAQQFANTAALINGGIGDAVKKLDTQAKATQLAANAAKTSAESAISASRAWIVPVGEVRPSPESITFVYKNVGSSPAIHVWVSAEYEMGDMQTNFSKGCDALSQRQMSRHEGWTYKSPIVLQGGTFEFPLGGLPDEWYANARPELDHRNEMQIHGCIWYDDVISNRARTTEFCYTAYNNRPRETPQQTVPSVAVFPCLRSPNSAMLGVHPSGDPVVFH